MEWFNIHILNSYAICSRGGNTSRSQLNLLTLWYRKNKFAEESSSGYWKLQSRPLARHIIIISAESTATWIYDLFKVFHVLRFMSSLESVRGEPGSASSLSFKYNLGRRRLSPALFLHHRDYMWQVTLHAVTQETVVVRARYTTGRTITLNNIDGTYRSSDAHGANDGRSASGVPLGRRPRTASPTPCSMHRCTASTWLWR